LIRVMLVDDEEMTREGLKEFISWAELDMVVVGAAEDGKEALERFDEWLPDLLLCDVRMPHMDGLELARLLKLKAPLCKIIFLSGYSDVAYLKSAIKLQAVDYVEKPVQIPELEELLARTGREIKQLSKERQQVGRIFDTWDNNKHELSVGLIRKLLSMNTPLDPEWPKVKEELALLSPSFPLEGYWICCVTAFADEGDKTDWRASVLGAAEEQDLQVLAAIVDGRGVAVVALESERHIEPVGLWLNKLVDRGKEGRDSKRAVGVGNIFHTISGLKESYEQALKALNYYFYRGWQSVLWARELPQSQRKNLLLFEKNHFIQYEEALKRQDFTEVEELLNQAVNELLLFPSPDMEGVRKKLFRWYIAMTKIYPDALWEFENDELWSHVFVSGELFTIRHFMTRRLEMIKEGAEAAAPTEKSVIRDVIRFIQQHYHEDISIGAIANHVYLTPTYLCLLFKKDRGVSINDYMTHYRIEQSKQLLGERKLKLYDVAQQVGYRDANYFAKVFRKLVGCNPSEYREKIGVPGR
jgi:two-component system response regulator YesN